MGTGGAIIAANADPVEESIMIKAAKTTLSILMVFFKSLFSPFFLSA
jgi:hypothetical protein